MNSTCNPVRSPRQLGLLIALLAALLACACTTKMPYRVSGRTCDVTEALPDKEGAIQWEAMGADGHACGDAWQVNVGKPVPFSVNFVEFDDQGVFASRLQAEAALANAARPEVDGSYVVVFVHGWHHQARPGDGHVRGFYDALASVSRWNPKRKIKGIYVGWRGDSIDLPYIDNLSFWDRKGTSDEVGRGALLEFLLRLEREVKREPGDKDKLVLIGHSFGASVTFNALSHVFLDRFVEGLYATNTAPRFRGYGDLVVLVNPAIEAMRFMPFQSALDFYARKETQPRLDFSHEQRAALVILSSEADFPTRRLFPVGRFFTTAFESHQRISDMASPDSAGHYGEWNMDLKTVGNYRDFQTHATVKLAPPLPNEAQTAQKDLAGGLSESCRSVRKSDMRRLLNISESAPDAEAFPDSRIKIRRLSKNRLEGSPYIVAAVDSEIVQGHNDIGGLNLVCWINQLLDTQESAERSLSEPVRAKSSASKDYR